MGRKFVQSFLVVSVLFLLFFGSLYAGFFSDFSKSLGLTLDYTCDSLPCGSLNLLACDNHPERYVTGSPSASASCGVMTDTMYYPSCARVTDRNGACEEIHAVHLGACRKRRDCEIVRQRVDCGAGNMDSVSVCISR